MRVAAVQHDVVWADKEANFARLAPMIDAAARAGARFVVLTEMYSTGFVMDAASVAEPVDGPSTAFLVEQARRHDVWVCGSLPELEPGREHPYNRLVVAAPDGTRHRYAKIHPFTYAREDEHYAAGEERVVVDVEGVRVGLFVCYDLRFADEFWALAPDVDAYVVPANWPESRREHWR
ncbi:MAG TPA: nitrilase-related carbon-nitrogen hydrolase, partial [Acidimicrobiia bacterium]|nr:nitrilase-related carbon-nitrogen hydrolase [Acidimicrobiia bacterium]